MADGRDILPEAVQFVLNGWSVLQLAVQNGFGGFESAEKAEWMIDVVERVLRDNGDIERHDLEDYIGEILNNEFNTIVEDGSLPKVAQTLCNFHRMWKEGRIADIEREISTAPKHKVCTLQMPSTTCDVTQELSQLQIHQNALEPDANPSSGESSSRSDSNGHPTPDEEGWEVVGKSKRR